MQYQVKDPSGQMHIIDGPEGASPDEVLAQAQKIIPYGEEGQSKGPSPILNTVQDTLELGGTVFGGLAGGAAGSAAGPIGTLAGGAAGAGLGRSLGTQIGETIKRYAGEAETPSLADQFKQVGASAVEGGKQQLMGEAVGAVAKPVISSIGETVNKGLAKLSKWKLGASAPEKAAEIAAKKKFNLPDIKEGDIEAGIENVQKTVNQVKTDAGAALNKAKSQVGIPTTVEEKEASLLTHGNTYGLGKGVINAETEQMLNAKTPEELSKNIAMFKKLQVAGNSDPALTARVANAYQERIGAMGVFDKKSLSGAEALLKKQYGDLAEIVNNNVAGLQGSKGDMAKALSVFEDLESKLSDLDKSGKAEGFLRNLFTSNKPMYKDYLKRLAQVEEMSGKPVLTDLFEKFTAEHYGSLVGSPKLASAAAAEIGVNLLHGNIPGAALGTAYLAGQSPAVIKALGKANAEAMKQASKAVASKLFKPVVIGGLNSLRDHPELRSMRDKLKNKH